MSDQSPQEKSGPWWANGKVIDINKPVKWGQPKGKVVEESSPTLTKNVHDGPVHRGDMVELTDPVWINENVEGEEAKCRKRGRAQPASYLLESRKTWPEWMKKALCDYTSAADTGMVEVSRFMVSDTNWQWLLREEKELVIATWARDNETEKLLEDDETSWTLI
ncbi:hypothetical protein PV05_07359 [Exophiala xenobiotica]|uniref:Uncharacterized protein n=1 Tax=Exophiala xenobiotica TaxID=348802 RepID=A0A0D2CY43_9EURO|nr:uncharacterized protein PV05_07359 [Exophiala xenobiotica]KIW55042.1 hypothetical protein PV05_07359 [Exophiala xenobiotica]